MDEQVGPDGTALYVARDEGERGSEAPFFAVFEHPDRTARWGYVCGNCGSFDTAMDTMGRIVCARCPNMRKPTEWDAAHE